MLRLADNSYYLYLFQRANKFEYVIGISVCEADHQGCTKDFVVTIIINGRFYTRGRIIRLDELRQTFVVGRIMRLQYKEGTRRIMRLDELSSVVRRSDEQRKVVRPDA